MTKMSGPLPGLFLFFGAGKNLGFRRSRQVGLGVMGCVGWTDCGNGDWAGAGFGSWAACGGSGVAAAGCGGMGAALLFGPTLTGLGSDGAADANSGAVASGVGGVSGWGAAAGCSAMGAAGSSKPKMRVAPSSSSGSGAGVTMRVASSSGYSGSDTVAACGFSGVAAAGCGGWGHPVPRLPGSVQLPHGGRFRLFRRGGTGTLGGSLAASGWTRTGAPQAGQNFALA